MPDGIAPVQQADNATSGTSAVEPMILLPHPVVFVYTVWMVDATRDSVWAYTRTLDRQRALFAAQAVKGLLTRDPLIGDFRNYEKLPQAGGTVA